MTIYLYRNIRKIPANLTCGDLMDLRRNLNETVNCCEGISNEQKQNIQRLIFVKIESKILNAIDAHLAPKNDPHLENTTSNLWSTSPQIPTINHNNNEFGHTPKRNSVHKTKHILNTKAAEEVRALRNISRKFNLFVKNAANPIKKPVNVHLTDDVAHENKYIIDISFGTGGNNIFIKFYNFSCLSPNRFYRFPINPVDKGINSRDFWTLYSRRVTKNIAKAIRAIENNPNNWDYTEVDRGALD